MGAGKSHIGGLLAQELALPHLDMDREISRSAGKAVGDIIFQQGELHFRKMERQWLEEHLPAEAYVLSTGGGTPCYFDNMQLINRHSTSIYLQAGVNTLYQRLEGSQAQRPMIAPFEGPDLREFIGKHLFERSIFYEEAILTFPVGDREPRELVSDILSHLRD